MLLSREIWLLNSMNISQLRLTEMLYSLETSYILILIGCFDEVGFTITFANRKHIIRVISGIYGFCKLSQLLGSLKHIFN